MKLIRLIAVLSVVSTVLLACGSQAATTSPTSVPAAAAPTSVPTVAAAPTSAPTGGAGSLVIYSGRSESLVKPLLEKFTADTGIAVEVRYGSTAEMAALILEEGDNSPADVFFGQDAGALGALNDQFIKLDDSLLNLVDARFRSKAGTWVGVSGRARVLVYNPDALQVSDLPASILDLTNPVWKGRIGWAPTNGSFQAFVTALRVANGEAAAKTWLEGMIANGTQAFDNNGAVLQAVAAGEIDAGLINHYYLYAAKKDTADIKAANYYFPNGDIGSLINVAGVGILRSSANQEAAQTFVNYLLSDTAQQFFADQTFEYPLIAGVATNAEITPLAEISSPDIDLSDLQSLAATLQLLQDVGAVK